MRGTPGGLIDTIGGEDLGNQGFWSQERGKIKACMTKLMQTYLPCAGVGVPKVVKAILKAGLEYERRVTTATLNMVLKVG